MAAARRCSGRLRHMAVLDPTVRKPPVRKGPPRADFGSHDAIDHPSGAVVAPLARLYRSADVPIMDAGPGAGIEHRTTLDAATPLAWRQREAPPGAANGNRFAFVGVIFLAATSCTTSVPADGLPARLTAGEHVWCLASTGAISSEAYSLERDPVTGIMRERCARPARFIKVPLCRDGQMPPAETPAMMAARARLSRDGSLQGDAFEGQLFCIPAPPR